MLDSHVYKRGRFIKGPFIGDDVSPNETSPFLQGRRSSRAMNTSKETCPCASLPRKLTIDQPTHLYTLERALEKRIVEGALRQTSGIPPGDVRETQPFPDDIIAQEFSCLLCGQRFGLGVDTYHGRGEWHVIGPARTSEKQD